MPTPIKLSKINYLNCLAIECDVRIKQLLTQLELPARLNLISSWQKLIKNIKRIHGKISIFIGNSEQFFAIKGYLAQYGSCWFPTTKTIFISTNNEQFNIVTLIYDLIFELCNAGNIYLAKTGLEFKVTDLDDYALQIETAEFFSYLRQRDILQCLLEMLLSEPILLQDLAQYQTTTLPLCALMQEKLQEIHATECDSFTEYWQMVNTRNWRKQREVPSHYFDINNYIPTHSNNYRLMYLELHAHIYALRYFLAADITIKPIQTPIAAMAYSWHSLRRQFHEYSIFEKSKKPDNRHKNKSRQTHLTIT